jgi:hypothetical protein
MLERDEKGKLKHPHYLVTSVGTCNRKGSPPARQGGIARWSAVPYQKITLTLAEFPDEEDAYNEMIRRAMACEAKYLPMIEAGNVVGAYGAMLHDKRQASTRNVEPNDPGILRAFKPHHKEYLEGLIHVHGAKKVIEEMATGIAPAPPPPDPPVKTRRSRKKKESPEAQTSLPFPDTQATTSPTSSPLRTAIDMLNRHGINAKQP